MKTELEEYFDLLQETLRVLGHVAEEADDAALAWAPPGCDSSCGSVVLAACADVRAMLGKQIIENVQATKEDYVTPAPTRAVIAEAIQETVAYVDWHKGKVTPAMLAEVRVEHRPDRDYELTVRRLLAILLRHLGARIGEARTLLQVRKGQG